MPHPSSGARAASDDFSIRDLAARERQVRATPSGQVSVYYGQQLSTGYDPTRDALFAGRTKTSARVLPLEEAYAQWYTWSASERLAWAERGYQLGLLKSPSDYAGAFRLWKTAAQEAGAFYTYGKKRVTPWKMLEMLGGFHGGPGGPGSAGPKTTTSTRKAFQIPSAQDAEGAVKTIFQGALGRDPSRGELDRYSSILVAKARANPQTIKTTTTVDPEGHSSSTSSTTGGFNVKETLQDEVQQTDEYGAYQAATTYMNALYSALGAA